MVHFVPPQSMTQSECCETVQGPLGAFNTSTLQTLPEKRIVNFLLNLSPNLLLSSKLGE